MKARLILIVLSLAVLAVLNWAVYDKEQILAHGEAVYLELAPVDPRSLMQGDYMRLNYAIANEINMRLPESAPLTGKDREDFPPHGFLVIRTDEKGVAHFVRPYKDAPLAPGEKLLRYKKNYWRLQIKPDSFFFQEGHGDLYREAKYGIFTYAGPETYLLTGLADAQFKKLGPILEK